MTTETRQRLYERAVTVHIPNECTTRAEQDAERRAKRERDDEARWGPARTRKAEAA